ncbi:DUF2927 domain-containing protein [Pacificibacter marinus]|uniref:DUF2927 domain-containing protein n=1 Tax=Pacificibacter marinus TaxID=658057 RepID=A0A1Y5SQ98_9RHOB|nr:Protein of unknown function [Pacificibacter marinus]SLN42819.1 hypothetical protein PAM7971_02059 [Pacificibacter marinus]
MTQGDIAYGRHSICAILVACAALTGCVAPAVSPIPQPRPNIQTAPSTVQTPIDRVPSAQSRAMADYYAKVQSDLLRNDLLRTDSGSTDAPFSTHQLARNFDAIALNDEYTTIGGAFVARTTPSSLHRWTEPVRIGLEFGASIPDIQRAKDRKTVTDLTERLARASGHSITLSSRPNFHVLVLNEDERQSIGPRLEQLIPGIGQAAIKSVENMPRSSYCLVIASDPADNGAYRQAVAIIRGEHPDLMRKSCFHEEIAQGLGLANDTPRARPSIFNDDEEFALLTPHDELLLRILYDPRLHTGMPPEIARPISAQIAREIMGDNN